MSSSKKTSSASQPSQSGYLLRQEGGLFMKSWKRYFLVLNSRSELHYYNNEEESINEPAAPKGSILINGSALKALDASECGADKLFGIGITPVGQKQRQIFVADNEINQIEWLSTMMQAGAIEDISSSISKLSISLDPLPPPPNAPMFPTSVYEGWLFKLGGIHKKTYQARYFVLLASRLLYFKIAGDPSSAKGNIDLTDAILNADAVKDSPYIFSIAPKEQRRHSIMTSLFGVAHDEYFMVCKDASDHRAWMNALKNQMEKINHLTSNEWLIVSDEEGSDEEEKEIKEKKSNTAATTPSHPSSSTSFTPPKSDLLSHLYKFEIEDGTLIWKKRFGGLDVKPHQLKLWKHKPTTDNTKFKVYDLMGASITVNEDVKCSKTKFHPSVLTITMPSSSAASGSNQSVILQLAPSNKSKFDEWHTLLLLSAGSDKSKEQPAQSKPQPKKTSNSTPHSAASSSNNHNSSNGPTQPAASTASHSSQPASSKPPHAASSSSASNSAASSSSSHSSSASASASAASAGHASPKFQPSTPVSAPPAATASAASSESNADSIRDTVSTDVDAWSSRGEGNLLSLLCTLHEIIPSLATQGQFIPPLDDGYPSLKEVKSTYLKAVVIVHPDKNKGKSLYLQLLSSCVFQCLQSSWERFERAEKKKQKKADKASAAD